MFKRHTFCVMYNLFVFGCFVMVPCAANEEIKASTLLNQDNEDNDQQVNCSIQLAEESINHELILKIQEGVNLIYIQLDFESGDDMAQRGMYQPLRWMQVQDDTGMEILKYDERRQILSMTMLKNVFFSTTISLIERPSRCLSNLSNEMYERKIRNFLLLGMKDAKEHDLDYKNIQDGVNICHLKLREEPFLQFYFSCCQITPRRHNICEDEIPSKSSKLFSLPLYLLIAFLPLLMAFEIGVTSMKIDVDSFTEDIEFNIRYNQGFVLSIPRKRLICSDEDPINFPDLLHESIILCKCKDKHAIECCERKIHGEKDWGTFLRKVTKFWKLYILLIVFIFRSTLYLAFEYPEEKSRHEFIREKSSFLNDQRNLFYFVCLWISFPLIFIISQISKEVTKNIKIFLHASMLDLKEIPFDRFLSWSIYILFLLVPTHGKVKSLIAFPFYLIIGIPFCVALVFLCIVPLNRMMLYFLLNFFPLDLMKRQFPFLDILKLKELYGNFRDTGLQIFSLERKNLRPRKLLHLIGFSLFLSLLLYSYIFLTIVCIQFVMMLVIYNVIGAIEDWDRYLAYLVFGSWIMIYSHKSWNSYRKVYKIYNREIHDLLLNLISKRLQSISLSKHTEDNLLILCITDSKNNKIPILIDNEKIDVPQMTIFFDQKSKSYILRDTFIDFMNSKPFGDKKVKKSKAFSHFISFVSISLFILLMFLITQKFLKGSNQIVVMLVTGVIPWIYDRYTGTSGHHVRILDSVEQIKGEYQEELDRLISKKHILKCSFPEVGKSQQEDGFIGDDDNDDYNDDNDNTQSLHEYSQSRQGYQRIADSEC